MQPVPDNNRPNFRVVPPPPPLPSAPLDSDDLIGSLLADTSYMFEGGQTNPPSALNIPLPPPISRSANFSVDDLLNSSSWLASTASANNPLPPPTYNPPPAWASPSPAYQPDFLSPAALESAPSLADQNLPLYPVLENETHPLVAASFGRRLGGAVIDAILAGMLVFAFNATIGSLLLGMALGNTENIEVGLSSSNEAAINNALNQLQTKTGDYSMISSLLQTAVSLCYYVLLVGLMSRTIGHMAVGIRVVRSSGEKAGFIAGFVRSFYGALPGLVGAVLAPSLIGAVFNGLFFESSSALSEISTILVVLLIVNLLTLVGFLWILFDKANQGWHDKLADTCVIRVQSDNQGSY